MEIVELGGLIVIGLEVRATFRGLWREVPRAWEALFERSDEIPDRKGSAFVDVSVEVVDGLYRQVVGTEVARADAVPAGMVRVDVPGRRYVHWRHEGPVAGVANSFARMYDWARAEGLPTGVFKLDRGYTPGFHERAHDLYVAVEE